MLATTAGLLLIIPPAGATSPGPRVDNGDGTYHLSLPSGASTASHWGGALFYVYDGQADFAWEVPAPSTELLDDDPVQEPDDGGLHGLVGSVSIDDLGRRWVVGAVDEPALLAKVAAYNIDIGGEPSAPSGQAPAQVADAAGELEWHPTSWSSVTCPGSGKKSFWYDTDTSVQSATPGTVSDSVALMYVVDNATISMTEPEDMQLRPECSGFFVDDKTVVTAAHCFFDPKERVYKYGSGQLVVCHRGNHATGAQCSPVSRRVVNLDVLAGGSKKSHRMSWDIGILKIEEPIGTGRRLRMSRAGVSVIAAEPSYSTGHPLHWNLPTCSDNTYSAVVVDYSSDGHLLYDSRRYVSHASEVVGSKSNILRTRHTAIGGWSGGPIYYYCPVSPVCSGSPFATAVMSAHFNRVGTRFTGGPLMRSRRTWVMGFME